MRTPEEVLDYWFGKHATTEAELMASIKRWYMGGPEVDRDVRERFGDAVKAALAGELDGWAEQARSRLALIILLDQFTRNTMRDDPGMYAGDTRAQRLATEAFDRGMDAGLHHVERMFLAMPLLHAEDLAMQRRSAALARELAAAAQPPWDKMSAMHVEQAAKYLGIVERFGRFPHRNAILGRASTPEEEEFLKTWAENARPSGAPTG